MSDQAPEVNPSRERASQSHLHGAGQVPADDPRLMPPMVPDTVPPPLGAPSRTQPEVVLERPATANFGTPDVVVSIDVYLTPG